MERYNKYLVLKIADIEKYLSDERQLKLDALVTCIRVGRLNDGKRDQEYVCVAADWPMHEQVWGMVEAFVDGKPNEIEQLQANVAELEEENARLNDGAVCGDCDGSGWLENRVEGRYPCTCMTEAEPYQLLAEQLATSQAELAAEQLNNKMLREALEFLNARIVTMDLGGVVERALSTPASTEALDKYVAEKVKEKTDALHYRMEHLYLVDMITGETHE